MRLSCFILALVLLSLDGPTEATAAPVPPSNDSLELASFEKGVDGFTKFVRDDHEPKVGNAAGRLDNVNQRWVTASKTLEGLGQDLTAITFWVRSADAGKIAIRLTDSTKQTFHRRLAFRGDGTWQQVTLSDFEKGEAAGGAGDKRWHGPPINIEFIFEHKGSIWIDDVQATLGGAVRPGNPAAAPGAVAAEQPPSNPLGNIFLLGQPVAITLDSTGETFDWKVTDFSQKLVAAGTSTVKGTHTIIRPDIKDVGYYLIRGTPKATGRTFQEQMTSFAIVRPHAVKDPLGSPFGVMTHFAQRMDTSLLPALKQIGIAAVRDEHYWAEVEKTRGTYDFSGKSDKWMAACKAAGIQPLVPMTFGNKLYDEGNNPFTPEGRLAYAKYGQAILDHYGDQVRWLEVWNEYNGTWLKGPAKEHPAKAYTEMLKVVYQQIKQKRPDVQVLGGGAVLIPLPWFEDIFQAGGLAAMDAVVIHPYRSRPEGVEREVAELQQLIRKFNKGKDKPIWVTETGRFDKSEYEWEVGRNSYELGRANAARYLVRQYTLLLSQGVSKVFWYLASDHQERVTMGLLRNYQDTAMGRFAVTPVYAAYANLIHQLDGAKFVRREAVTEHTRARVYAFEQNGQQVRVCWSTRPAVIRLRAATPVTIADVVGTEREVKPAEGAIILPLTEDAVFVRGAVQAVEELPGVERIVADSLDDYTKKQGQNGWYYGYYDGSGKGRGDGAAPKGPYTDDDFQLMTQKETAWGYEWASSIPNLMVGPTTMHPGKVQARDACAVARWVSSVGGAARIKGSFVKGSSKGDGVTVQVLVDGQVVYTQPVGGSSAKRAELDVALRLHRGSLVDVSVRPNTTTEFDSTEYEVRIVQPK